MRAEARATTGREASRLPFRIRGSMQTLLALQLLDPEDPAFFSELVAKIAYAPEFYRDAPILIDVGPVRGRPPIDLEAFIAELLRHRLRPVGLVNASETWREAAQAVGLAVFPEGAEPPSRRPPAQPVRGGAAMVVDRPVRGGEQIVAREGDLVVLAPVGHGAELAAVGHVHVYAPLRGRAFAGIEGDERAMIFCDRLEAELLSIAGVYTVAEEMDPRLLGARVRVQRRGEQLVVTPLS